MRESEIVIIQKSLEFTLAIFVKKKKISKICITTTRSSIYSFYTRDGESNKLDDCT